MFPHNAGPFGLSNGHFCLNPTIHVYNKHNRHKNTTLTHKKHYKNTNYTPNHLENQVAVVVVVVVAAVVVVVVVVAAVVVAVVVVGLGRALGF